MSITYHALSSDIVRAIRAGGPDSHGQRAERVVSTGQGTPCRSCLDNVPKGEGQLIFALRPFPALQPYAETGPVFLCENQCTPWSGDGAPPILRNAPEFLVKAYGADDRIVYGTGQITAAGDVSAYAQGLLSQGGIAYVDVRSARNNCFLTRIT